MLDEDPDELYNMTQAEPQDLYDDVPVTTQLQTSTGVPKGSGLAVLSIANMPRQPPSDHEQEPEELNEVYVYKWLLSYVKECCNK
jgi:hypothetical protein